MKTDSIPGQHGVHVARINKAGMAGVAMVKLIWEPLGIGCSYTKQRDLLKSPRKLD